MLKLAARGDIYGDATKSRRQTHDMKWYSVLGISPRWAWLIYSFNSCYATHTKCLKVPEWLLVSVFELILVNLHNCSIWHKANLDVDMKQQNNAIPMHDNGVLFIFIGVRYRSNWDRATHKSNNEHEELPSALYNCRWKTRKNNEKQWTKCSLLLKLR